jgi:hypothetical protein
VLTIGLFVLAALVFSILAGMIETRWAREGRRRLLEPTPVLHPLSRHRLTWIRPSSPRRMLRHVAFFVGFFLTTYAGMLVLKVVGRLVAAWVS